jgi:hypothetical protein
VENSSALGPVAVEITCFQESVSLFKEEVISNKLFTLCFCHAAEAIEGSGKLSLEGVASLDHLLLDFVALLSCDAWTERIISEIASDANARRFNHSCIFSWEWWALQFSVIHVAYMLGILGVAVILLNDFVHQRGKGGIRVVATSVDTNS